MKLIEWMNQDKLDVLQVSKLCGVSVHTVKKWLRPLGDREGRTPRPAKQIKIREVSGGKVTPNDWIS